MEYHKDPFEREGGGTSKVRTGPYCDLIGRSSLSFPFLQCESILLFLL